MDCWIWWTWLGGSSTVTALKRLGLTMRVAGSGRQQTLTFLGNGIKTNDKDTKKHIFLIDRPLRGAVLHVQTVT